MKQNMITYLKTKTMRWFLLFVLLIYILLSGKNYYSNELLEKKIDRNAIYLYDSDTKVLVSREVDEALMEQFTTNTQLVRGIIELLYQNDKETFAVATLPEGLTIRTIRVDQKHVIINFDESIFELDPLDELLVKASIIKSLTSFDAFTSVEFFLNGVPIKADQQYIAGKFQRRDILTSYDDVVNRVFSKTVTLYSPTDDQSKLRQFYQDIDISPNKKVEEVIVETLLNNNESPIFPKDTKLLNVYTNQEVCFVDLSSECQTNYLPFGISERIAVYSIVNSLTDLPNVTHVQILVEGQMVKSLQGNLSLNRLLTKNYALIELNE